MSKRTKKEPEEVTTAEAIQEELRELLKKYQLETAVLLCSRAKGIAGGQVTRELLYVPVGEQILVEGLCAWGYGYSSGARVMVLDHYKAAGLRTRHDESSGR